MSLALVVIVIEEGSLMYVARALILDYYFFVLEFPVENLPEDKALLQGMSLPSVVGAKVWIPLLCRSGCWVNDG